MTAQSSGTESAPPGRHQRAVTEGQSGPGGGAGGAPDGLTGRPVECVTESPLDAFLHTEPHMWGGMAGTGEHGFAALRFDATPGSVTRTRSFLRSTLTGWQLPDLVDDATTIAAELVANAVTHALRPA